ncbi:MAG: glycosyltransferase [Terriglobales bacterium]
MNTVHAIAGGLLAILWFSRVIAYAWGLPRVPDITLPEWGNFDGKIPLPRVSIIVPARNEAAAVEGCITSRLALDYPDFEVFSVNDRSTDATGSIMDGLANSHPHNSRLKVIHVTELPPGWMGKTHAMWLAGKRSTGDILLFTDGDTCFHPDSIRRAVNYLLASNADHFVVYPTMLFKSAGERMMISYFHAMLSFIHRPWKIADPKALDHVGVGAFNMVRRSAYEAIGTYEAMRMEVIDDLRLGRLIKLHGLRQRVALGPGVVTLHWVSSAMGIVRNLGKNSFAALRFQWTFVFAACLGLAYITLLPIIGLVFAPGWTKLGYALALVGILAIYFQTARITTISPGYFFLHPVGAVLAIYTILRSAWITSRHGVTWRGTSYPLEQFQNVRK